MDSNIKSDKILSIEIDNSGKLHIKPEWAKFILVYRTATEVHWDADKQTIYSPKPREWKYLDWFKHMLGVAKSEFSVELKLTNETQWINIPDDVKKEITKAQGV